MTRDDAQRIVTLCETVGQGPSVMARDCRQKELRAEMDAIRARGEPPAGTLEYAEFYASLYERVYLSTADGEYISEQQYFEAKRVLNPEKGGRPTRWNELHFFGALGKVLSSLTPVELTNPTKRDEIADRVLHEYDSRRKGGSHSKMHEWVKRFLREYQDPT